MEPLLPCPFCGKQIDTEDPDVLYPTGIYWRFKDGAREYVRHRDRLKGDLPCYAVNCPEVSGGCGAEMGADTKVSAMRKWNRRTGNGTYLSVREKPQGSTL